MEAHAMLALLAQSSIAKNCMTILKNKWMNYIGRKIFMSDCLSSLQDHPVQFAKLPTHVTLIW